MTSGSQTNTGTAPQAALQSRRQHRAANQTIGFRKRSRGHEASEQQYAVTRVDAVGEQARRAQAERLALQVARRAIQDSQHAVTAHIQS